MRANFKRVKLTNEKLLELWQRWCFKIKATNQKYIVIIGMFVLTLISPLIIPILYIQLLTSPICLYITYRLLYEEYESNPPDLRKEKLQLSFKVMTIAVFAQFIINFLSSLIITPNNITFAITTIIPVYTIYTVTSAAILEEIIFRRIIFGWMQGKKVKFSIIAATLSSLLFATVHLSTTLFLGYFAIGMIFCYYYHSTKSIQTTIVAHMFFNFYALFGASVAIVIGGK